MWLLLIGLLGGGCTGGNPQPEGEAGPMVLDYNFGALPTTLDPAFAIDQPSLDVSAQLFEGLTQFDGQRAEALPALASEWDVSEDGLTYTFRLRADAWWVNQRGEAQREVQAEDVVYAIKRVCLPDTHAPHGSLLFIIKGCQEVSESVGIPDPDRVGVRALEPLVVEFTLTEPAAYFPILASLPVLHPVPREVIEAHGAQWTAMEHLLSNGPFLVQAWQPDSQITLVKNERYYAASAVSIVRVNGYLMDEASALEAFRAGKLDIVPVPASEREPLQASGTGQVQQVADPCIYAYGFTMVKPPLDSPRVRRALSLAIDRVWLVEQVLGGSALPTRHLAPPAVFGALPADTLGVTADVPQAQRLLAEAGYPAGQGFPVLSLLYPSDEAQGRVARAVAEMWQTHLGIEVTVQEQPLEAYRTTIQNTTPLEEMPHVWALGWCAPYPDAHAWLHALFNVRVPPTERAASAEPWAARRLVQAGGNHVRRIATRFDDLTEQAVALSDAEGRRALYAEAEQRLLVEEAVIAPLYHPATTMRSQPWLTPTLFVGLGVPLKTWRVDMLAKAGPLLTPTP